MGYTAWKKNKFPCLTAKLNANYVGPAVKGSWVYGYAELTRASEAYLIAKSFLFAKKYPFAINSFC